jgi:2'-5' RNA ligase
MWRRRRRAEPKGNLEGAAPSAPAEEKRRDGARPSKMRKNRAIVYWLMPAKSKCELLREIIRILARQFDAPGFEPHLTLLATPADRRSPKAILQQIEASPIRLRVRRTASSSRFTKTLFVRFESSKSLEKLIIDLGRAVKTRRQKLRDPHVSLLYKKLPARVKKELALTIKLPFQEMKFDSIQAVGSVLPIRDRCDVEAWEVLATRFLRR